jgi:hypothetical protein
MALPCEDGNFSGTGRLLVRQVAQLIDQPLGLAGLLEDAAEHRGASGIFCATLTAAGNVRELLLWHIDFLLPLSARRQRAIASHT